MFDALSTRLQDVFQSLKGETRLTEATVEAALREIRLALLEADVNFKVVKAFIDRVRDRAMDQAVLKSLTPSQQVVKIVRDELLALFGDAKGGLQDTSARPRVILMLGLQGSGKTTTSAKLGKWLQKQGRHPLLVSTDVRRPAAIQQLAVMAEKAGVRVHDPAGEMDPVARATQRDGRGAQHRQRRRHRRHRGPAAHRRRADGASWSRSRTRSQPVDLLYVADAMTGQDAIKSAGEFNRQVGVTGVVLTKIDGDARGGAALSVVSVVGVPIAFVGAGERIEDLEAFHADRFVSRLLGMGDVLSLIEKAEEAIDENEAEKLEEKIRKGGFSLEDFRDQLKTLRKMGPLEHILGLLPGMGNLKQLADQKPDERQLRRIEADDQLDDARRAQARRHHRRQPPQAHRARQRHGGRGRQPAAEAVQRDAADAEDGRTDDRAADRRAAEEEEEKGPVQSDEVARQLQLQSPVQPARARTEL